MFKKLRVLAYYSFLPWSKRIFISFRLLSCPFLELIDYIPQKGSLLDVGTGFGLLPLLLTKTKHKQHIDPDINRIKCAKKASQAFPNLQFKSGIIHQLKINKKFSSITIIDVLYLLPKLQKQKMIQSTRNLLKSNGQLLLKINDRSFSLSFFLTWLQEKITIHLLGETTTSFPDVYFENVVEVKKMLRNNGFKVKKTVRLRTPFPFFHQHWLVIGEKKHQ